MLPTPEQERAAVWALCACLGLAIFGAVAGMILFAVLLREIGKWVFG